MIQFFSKKLSNKKGFTLVELLLVIAILGIIAGVAVPRVLNANTSARFNADQGTARMIVSKIEALVLLDEIDAPDLTAWHVITDLTTGDLDYQEDVPNCQSTNADFYVAISKDAAGLVTIVVTDVVAAMPATVNTLPAESTAFTANSTTFASGQAQPVSVN